MASLQQEVRERLKALGTVGKQVKAIITACQAFSRLVKRLRNRRKALPDEKDFQDIMKLLQGIAAAANVLSKVPGYLTDIWRIN